MGTSSKLTCPLCSPKDIKARPLGDLVRHMAMKRDELHQEWREKHKLPPHINVYNFEKWRQQVKFAISKDWDMFTRQGGLEMAKTDVARFWEVYHSKEKIYEAKHAIFMKNVFLKLAANNGLRFKEDRLNDIDRYFYAFVQIESPELVPWFLKTFFRKIE